MSVILLRHGPTAYNTGDSNERLRAWLDLPLSPLGQRVAIVAAQRLKGIHLAGILSSDLQRASDTAKVWSATTGVPLSLHPELRPWHLGDFAGQRVEAVQHQLDALLDTPTIPTPGGESLNTFLDRYLPFIMPLIRDRRRYGVVTHIRNLVAIRAHLAATSGRINLAVWREAPLIGPGQALSLTAADCIPLDSRTGVGTP